MLGVSPCTFTHHTGDLARENSQARAERIIAEHLVASGWNSADLNSRPKSDPAKLALSARLRRETALTVKQIAERLSLSTPKSATTALHRRTRNHPEPAPSTHSTHPQVGI